MFPKTNIPPPLDMSRMTDEEIDAEVLKGLDSALSGTAYTMADVFEDLERKLLHAIYNNRLAAC